MIFNQAALSFLTSSLVVLCCCGLVEASSPDSELCVRARYDYEAAPQICGQATQPLASSLSAPGLNDYPK